MTHVTGPALEIFFQNQAVILNNYKAVGVTVITFFNCAHEFCKFLLIQSVWGGAETRKLINCIGILGMFIGECQDSSRDERTSK